MKTIKYIVISLFAAAVLSGCAKHDFFNENLITGRVGPQAIWEPNGAVVRGGTPMGFRVDYYTTEEVEISHLEVWYNVLETEFKEIFSPFAPRFTVRSSTTEQARISQMIKRYDHSRDYWNDSIRSNRFTGEFPVSSTLSPYNWVHPDNFDGKEIELIFGENFMKWFQDSLGRMMVFNEYRSIIMGLSLMSQEEFTLFTDSTKDENTGAWVRHFPGDSINPQTGQLVGKTVVPREIAEIYAEIPFEDLIRLPGGAGYNVTYRQSSSINALIRVYDTRGVFGATGIREIDVN